MDKGLRAFLMSDYAAYCQYVHNGNWKATKFHKYLCDITQDFLEKDTGHAYDILILSTPPQHGKSMTISETLPSWYLGRNPKGRVIEVSYSEDFARRFGRRNRQKIMDFGGEVFNIKLGSPNTDLDFELDNNIGGMISRGVMSGITGQRANLIIIDDPIKNREEADSDTTREKIKDEFLNSMLTRMAVGGKIIIIMTRWHEDDLAGWILGNVENVTCVNLPLEAEENDPLGRKVGDALCPEIGKDNEWLADFKKAYTSQEGSRSWNALFQGHPTALEGAMFKREWWQFYDTLPELAEMVMSVDAAFKDGEDNDFVAIQVWGKVNADMYLVDRVKNHLNLPDTMREIIRLRAMYPKCNTTLIEDKANGSAIIDILRKQMTGIIAVNPLGGKVSRANAVVGAVESGNVHLPKKAKWTGEYIDEFAAFPNGKHDDEVDCSTQAWNRLIYHSAKIKKVAKKTPFEMYFPKYSKKSQNGDPVGKRSKINVV